MKAHLPSVLLAAAVVIGAAGTAAAQQSHPELPRGDAWLTFGWLHDRNIDEDAYRTNGNRRVAGGAGAGLYWSPNFRIDIDTNTPSRGAFQVYEQIGSGQFPTTRYGRVTYDRWGVGVVQNYDFLPNAWFTPYVGLGFDAIGQTREEYFDAIFTFDPVTRQQRRVAEEIESDPERRTLVRPLVAVGFKAYMTRRAFFRTDTRVAFHGGVDEVRIRLGFGVDF